MPKNSDRLNFNKIHTYPIRERESKIKIAEFAKGIPKRGVGFREYLDGLPDASAGRDFRRIANLVVASQRAKKPVIFCLGAYVIKCGLSPIIIALMEKQIITAVALDGTGSVHDFEVALIGATSEDLTSGVEDGTFGMVEETGRIMNETLAQGARQGVGAGAALGERILREDFPYREYSILAKGIELDIPVTVHIAIGADVLHQHPSADGAAIGEASFVDFQIFSTQVSQLGSGGMLINFCTEPVLQEVFLKALIISRNLGHQVKDFARVDFGMMSNCKPEVDMGFDIGEIGGRDYSIIGQPEIVMPMLAQAIVEYWE